MTRRRADKLDPRSREGRLALGVRRVEIELPAAACLALDLFAAEQGLSRSAAVLLLIRTIRPAEA